MDRSSLAISLAALVCFGGFGCTAEEEPEPIPDESAADSLGARPKFESCDKADAIATRDEFDSLESARDKLQYHVEWTACTRYENLPRLADAQGTLRALLKSALAIVQPTTLNPDRAFDNPTDELETGREKFIHTVGSTAAVEFVRMDELDDPACPVQGYTGLIGALAEGDSIPAIARLAWAGDPELTLPTLIGLSSEVSLGFLPGLALKLFIDGSARSINLLALAGFEGALEKDLPAANNFFAQAVATSVPTAHRVIGFVLTNFLGKFGKSPRRLSLEEPASLLPDGNEIGVAAVFPDNVVFAPREEAFAAYAAGTAEDFRIRFEELAVGTPMYDLYARASETGCRQYLTTMVLATPLVASAWGDWSLYFRHPVEGQR